MVMLLLRILVGLRTTPVSPTCSLDGRRRYAEAMLFTKGQSMPVLRENAGIDPQINSSSFISAHAGKAVGYDRVNAIGEFTVTFSLVWKNDTYSLHRTKHFIAATAGSC